MEFNYLIADEHNYSVALAYHVKFSVFSFISASFWLMISTSAMVYSTIVWGLFLTYFVSDFTIFVF